MWGESVEKLDRILHAEDAARHTVEEARVAAAQALNDARAKAAELLRAERAVTAATAASTRDDALVEAQEEAAGFAERARTDGGVLLAGADANEDAALAAVLEALKGQ